MERLFMMCRKFIFIYYMLNSLKYIFRITHINIFLLNKVDVLKFIKLI